MAPQNLGIVGGKSSTFEFVLTDEEEEEIEQAFMRGMSDNNDLRFDIDKILEEMRQ